MPTDTTTRVIRAYHELQSAKDALRAANITVPMGMDDAAGVLAHGLESMGVPVAERTDLFRGGAKALRIAFDAYAKNPAARRRLALDSEAVHKGFASRFPKATPMRSV